MGIRATRLASITVAFTGFRIVGNLLWLFGFTPMLGDRVEAARWYLERRIYLAVGININIASVLTLVYNLCWLAFTGFVGAAMIWFARRDSASWRSTIV